VKKEGFVNSKFFEKDIEKSREGRGEDGTITEKKKSQEGILPEGEQPFEEKARRWGEKKKRGSIMIVNKNHEKKKSTR